MLNIIMVFFGLFIWGFFVLFFGGFFFWGGDVLFFVFVCLFVET